MYQLDLYIFLLLLATITIGVIRGFSGELGSLLKLILTIVISYKLIAILNDKLDFSFTQNIWFPITIYTIVYILTSFFLKIILFQMVFILRTITPNMIDKPLGALLGFSKIIFILTIIYIITVTVIFSLKIDTPTWLKDTKTEKHFNNLSITFLNIIPNVTYDEDEIGNNSLLTNILSLSSQIEQTTPESESDIETSPPDKLKLLDLENKTRSEQLQTLYKLLKTRKHPSANITPQELEEYDLDELIEELEKN